MTLNLTNTGQLVSCHHCGSDCDDTQLQYDGHAFCCNGCFTVYSILKEHNLDRFYQLEKVPGLKPEGIEKSFSFLELPEVVSKIVQYQDEDQVKLNLFVPEIHCASCIYLLENLNKIDGNIVSSRVNFAKKELSLTAKYSKEIYHRIFSLLNKLGYEVNIDVNDHSVEDKVSRSLLINLGITGFCFGNIMLLTIPGYLSKETISAPLHYSFLAISILLTIPVLIFGAKDYYTKALKSFSQKYLSIEVPIALGITALLVNSLVDIMYYRGVGYLDSLAGLVFFLLVGKWFQSKTYKQFSFEKDVKSFFPIAVLREENGAFLATNVNTLAEGDIIKLRHGEILPVNAILLNDDASFDYSFVTGESATIKKSKNDLLFAGGKLKNQSKTFIVKNSVDQSYLSELWNSQKKSNQKGIKYKLDIVSHYFTITIILIALVGFFYWAMNGTIQKSFIVFTSTLIVACPCALALAQPFTYGSADRLLGLSGIYLKHAQLIEQLSKIKSIVFDKTGTLTISNSENISYIGRPLSSLEMATINTVCSSSIHPMSRLIVSFLKNSIKEEDIEISHYEEFPGKGIRATFSSQNHDFHLGSLNWMAENHLDISLLDTLTLDVKRSHTYIAFNKTVVGCFEFSDKYRANIKEIFDDLSGDYDLAILSGDTNKEEAHLKSLLPVNSTILFEQNPIDKLNFVKQIKETKPVMMIGDGINDSGALAESSVGISLTEQSGHFTPASDIIMQANKINKLPELLDYTKDCQKVLYLGLLISFLYNTIGIYFAFNGWLSPYVAAILMPISSVTVVALSTSLTYYFAKRRKLIL